MPVATEDGFGVSRKLVEKSQVIILSALLSDCVQGHFRLSSSVVCSYKSGCFRKLRLSQGEVRTVLSFWNYKEHKQHLKDYVQFIYELLLSLLLLCVHFFFSGPSEQFK